jgi:hypothetical protein
MNAKTYPIYKRIAMLLAWQARICGNTVYECQPSAELRQIMKDFAPSGSGIDCGTTLASDSTAQKLIFDVSFHHMDKMGGYDGWTEHKVIVTPSLAMDYDLRITGKNRNDIKTYLYDVYSGFLSQQIRYNAESKRMECVQ